MKIFSRIQSFFRLSDDEIKIYHNEISETNARNAFYLSLVAIPVSFAHIIFFSQKLNAATGIELQWVHSIIYTHLSLFVIATLMSVLLYFFIYRGSKNKLASRICTSVVWVMLIILGAALSAFDQNVTPSITPFIITTILVGLFFQIQPTLSVIYFSLSYVIFHVAISQTQVNQDILFSNQANGLSITAIGLSLSLILWHSRLTRIKQKIQITKQNQALSESNAEKDKFFSIIAHDLKSPFNAILGFSDLLEHQVKEKEYDRIEEYTKLIKQSSKSAMDLLMNLMDWSRAHTGKMEFKPEHIKLNELVEESENLFHGLLLQKKISITLNIPDNTVVYADKNMIRTVLRNLISNAIKFSHPDGQIVLAATQNQYEHLISVTDNGVGISEEAINRLFRIDQNYSTTGTQNEKGTGLGLILCKELIEKHRGRIWCESETGKGSTFYFSLPISSESSDN